jgi:ATP-dependent DNA helicase RecG
VDADLKRRVDALRRPLELASADNFAGVRKVQGLGHVLRIACDQVLAKQAVDGLATWRQTIERWEALDETQQAVEVARGMRLLARIPKPAGSSIDRSVVERSTTRAAPVPQRAAISSATDAKRAAKVDEPPLDRPAPKRAARVDEPPVDRPAPKRASKVDEPPVDRPAPKRAARVDEPPIDPLAAPTHTLPGIGPAFAERLAEKGLVTVEDLLWTLPRRYDDVRDARSLADACALDEGQRVTFAAKVASSRMVFVRGRRWAEVRLGGIDLTDRTNCVVRWFNVWAGIEKRMPAGALVVLSGVVRKRGGRAEFANPDILGIEIDDAGPKKALASILPRYPDVAGVPGSRLRQACATACERVGATADDGVPAHVEQAAGMPRLAETLSQLHSPPPEISTEDLAAMNRGDSKWQRRLAFGELFSLGIAVALRRRQRRGDRAMPCARTKDLDAAIAKALPFAPTKAQLRTIKEIGDDLASAIPMNRLLQGDVGAGKTAVAFAAALQVARAKRQTAVMAPTELLAEQHAETWKRWAASAKLRVELLTSSTPKGVRASLLSLLAAGQLDVLIGTHALLSEGVGFGALGLVVIDEQHRFGVAQRAKLRDKGDGQGSPHLLVMTATPIPRTLALTAYGDLDVSVLDELPPGRKPITTKLLSGARGRTAATKLVAERVALGERAYVVCPKVGPGEDADDTTKWKDATTVADELGRDLPNARVGLVHGRLDITARDRVMRAFKSGELDVLVATTVIEVGVDVPDATVMVIHDADRFGLAQLHQLRGRVGRGGTAAQCMLLVQGSSSEDAEKRLATMVATTDGFRIAEEDLLLRGAGELLGARQAGVPRLSYGDLHQHTELLLEARRHADAILDGDPDLVRPENAALRRALDRRTAHEVYGAESG